MYKSGIFIIGDIKMLTIKQLYKQSKQYKRAKSIAKQRNKLQLEQQVDSSEEWYKLDNAGLIFPAIQQSSWNSMFRLSAYLYEQVDAEILEKAINDIMPRFPAFNVSLKRGFFWYYFQQLDKPIKVEKESSNPCSAIPLTSCHALESFTILNNPYAKNITIAISKITVTNFIGYCCHNLIYDNMFCS